MTKRPAAFGFKHGLVALSALAVVGGWWLLARAQSKAESATPPALTVESPSQLVLASPDLPPVPEVVQPQDLGPVGGLAAAQGTQVAPRASAAAPAQAPRVAQQAPAQSRPMVRTRSSR